MKRIGFDLDGVFADFVSRYQRLFVIAEGKNLFHPEDNVNPPMWNWPQFRGYTDTEVKKVWKVINSSPTFWASLPETPHMETLRAKWIRLCGHGNEVYFIANRTGQAVKLQTEKWLQDRGLCLQFSPTVLIVKDKMKGAAARAFNLDAYIDDNYDNLIDVADHSPSTRLYLLNRSYNLEWWSGGGKDLAKEWRVFDKRVEAGRVLSVAEMLHREGI